MSLNIFQNDQSVYRLLMASFISLLSVVSGCSTQPMTSNVVSSSNAGSSPASTSDNVLRFATQGDAKAQLLLGLMYESGKGVQQNDVTALAWYKRSAEQGLPEAQYDVGRFY